MTAQLRTSLRRNQIGSTGTLLVSLIFAGFAAARGGSTSAGEKKHDRMGKMDMNCMADMNGVDMSTMGPSMAGMECHMYVTPLRPPQPGDEEKARAVVAAVRLTMEKYKDYRKAVDPSKPTSLLYIETPTQRFKLQGVMFTARPSATEDELNERIPLSVGHWNKHINFCAAPADKVQEYHGDHPKFGMFGSIHTKAACDAEGGTFMPTMFTWMIHVFPHDPKEVFSMDDDVPHVR